MRYRRSRGSGIWTGIILLALFAVWTVLIQYVDVQIAGESQTELGFATVNTRFHDLTGVHMEIYDLTDMLHLVPLAVCACFGILGLVQMIRRKGMSKVDKDILLLGVYYILVILAYLLFDALHINYRPVLIEGKAEPSYPSSTTLLVLSVMPTLVYQANRRLPNVGLRITVIVLAVLFSAFMVIGRIVYGVHWLTDFPGAIFLSAGLFLIYRGVADKFDSQ